MSRRVSAFLAVFCLTAAVGVRPAAAGAQGSDPLGVGDVPADTHLPGTEPNQPDQPAAAPAPEAAPKKKVKKAKSSAAQEGTPGAAPAGDANAPAGDKAAAPAEALSGSALIVALRQTGYTLVVRHAEAAQTSPDKASADPENDKLEPQLDTAGRQQAKMLGVTLRALDVPIGEILSSPAYRARETMSGAKFGDPIIEPELDEGAQGMATPASTGPAPSGDGAWLKAAVAKPPRLGTNRLIVTHLPLIIAAFGKEFANVAPAETLVLKPDGEGDATVVGRLKIEVFEAVRGK